MRQVLIICFALALLATGCTSKPADQASTTQPNQQQTPSPSPSPQTSTAPNATDSAAKGDDANKNKPADQASKQTPAPQAPKGAAEQPVVSTDQYGKVEMGMTFDEVSKAMGQMGKLISEFKESENSNPVVTYEYKLKDGGSAKITFRDGKVTSKSDSSGGAK